MKKHICVVSGNRTRVPLVTSWVCYHCTITTTLLATEQSVRFTGKPQGSPAFNHIFISDRLRKNMPAVDSKTVTVARGVLTTPLARRIPPTQACDRDFSSRGPCQHRTFTQAQTTQQTQSITKLYGTQIDKSD